MYINMYEDQIKSWGVANPEKEKIKVREKINMK